MYGGSVISCSTAERARCEIHEASDLVVRERRRRVAGDPDPPPIWSRAATGSTWAKAVLKGLDVRPGTYAFHLKTSTEIPMQAGLAGSTALVAAVFRAVAHRRGLLHSHWTAEAIRNIEYEIMGVICGFQDQYMAVFGGLNYMDFRDKRSDLKPTEMPYATVEPLADDAPPAPILLAHTGVKHHSGTVHKSVRERWLEGDPEVRAGYERIQHLARWGKEALLTGDWECLADAMNENQKIQHDFGASGEVNDRLIAVARENGALAGKLAGAGHGGTILALTLEPERTAHALMDAGADRILTPRPVEGLTVEFTT